METKKMPPIHPGEILLEEFLKPLKISQTRLAREIGVPYRRVNEIVQGKRGITPDTALRFSVYFKTTPEFWMSLQIQYELRVLKQKLNKRYEKINPYSERSEQFL